MSALQTILEFNGKFVDEKQYEWGFDDPAKAQGTEEEKWATFQRVRDEVGERIKHFAETGK